MDIKSSLRADIVAWINYTSIIPWLDHGVTQWILSNHAGHAIPARNDDRK
ncbi:hypothetical protein [Candidatus Rickettsia colombianensi]|nr:hypothetical protein [Candidatus Rickettsia colombianensi]